MRLATLSLWLFDCVAFSSVMLDVDQALAQFALQPSMPPSASALGAYRPIQSGLPSAASKPCSCQPWADPYNDPIVYAPARRGCVDGDTAAGYYPGCGPAPAACDLSQCCALPPIIWGGRAGALFLSRDDSDHDLFSYDSAIETNQLLDASEANEDFLPGVEARLVRFNLCTMRGIEGVYWGLYPSDGMASVYSTDVTGNLDPILDYSQLTYDGDPASAYTNDALVHRLRTSTEIHNVELNRLWGWPTSCRGWSPWTVTTLAGIRCFNFDENLAFAADTMDTMFTGSPDELYYTIDTDNNLYGGQLGAYFDRTFAGHWSARSEVKAGVFANDASAVSRIGGAAGTAVVNNGPNVGREWLVSADKCDVAFLGELRAGLTWQATAHWRIVGDYRVMAVSGLALPTEQIYHDLRGLQDVELLSTDSFVVLHGAFVGAEWSY